MSDVNMIPGLIMWPAVGGLPKQEKNPAKADSSATQKAPSETAVRTPLIYTLSQDTSLVTIDKIEVKNILLKNLSNIDQVNCSDSLLSMNWLMLAKSIAKDVYGQDVDSAKAAALSSILSRDNLAKDPSNSTPAEILKQLPISIWKKLMAVTHFQFHWNQYVSYLQLVKDPNAFFQYGAFPNYLPVKLSGNFKHELAQPAVPAAPAVPAEAPVKAAKKQKAPKKSEEVIREPKGETDKCGSGQMISPMTGECVDIEQ